MEGEALRLYEEKRSFWAAGRPNLRLGLALARAAEAEAVGVPVGHDRLARLRCCAGVRGGRGEFLAGAVDQGEYPQASGSILRGFVGFVLPASVNRVFVVEDTCRG